MNEQSERKYPCIDCGKLRTKAEGGTIFTVCDACWERRHAEPRAEEATLLDKSVGSHPEEWAKADEDGLLDPSKMLEILEQATKDINEPVVDEAVYELVGIVGKQVQEATAKAQRDLTAAAKLAGKDRKCRERMIKSYRNGVEQGNAECQAKLEQVFAWGNERCLDHHRMMQNVIKRYCSQCWQEKWLKEGK